MFADFNKAFFKENATEAKIPREVLKSLSENLPDGFEYTELDHGLAGIIPQDSNIELSGLKLDWTDSVFDGFKPSNLNEAMEYLYRTQRKYEIELTDEDSIIINGVSFKVGKIIEMPFEEKEKRAYKFTIIPQPFQPPFEVRLEGNGVIKKFYVERQPYSDMNKSLFKSINSSAFEISYVIDEKKLQLQFNFNVKIENATDVEEVVEILKLYHACMMGNIKLNGEKLSGNNNNLEEKSVLETIKFWEKVLKLQEVLKVKFSPKSQLEMEDIVLVEELYRTLIEKKPFKEYIKIKDITIKEINGVNIEDLVGREGLSISFHQSSDVTILGVNLKLYSIVVFFDFRVEGFKPLEEEQSYILFIEPIESRKIYQSSIHFCSEAELKSYTVDINELQNAEIITID